MCLVAVLLKECLLQGSLVGVLSSWSSKCLEILLLWLKCYFNEIKMSASSHTRFADWGRIVLERYVLSALELVEC